MGDWVFEIGVSVDQAIFASGDLMSAVFEIPQATMDNGTSTLLSVVAIDYDDQGGDFDLIFFDQHPGAVGALNAAVALTDAQAAMVCGFAQVTNEYSDLGNNQVATVNGIGLAMHPRNGTSLWVLLVSRDTKTYAGGYITLKIGLLRS